MRPPKYQLPTRRIRIQHCDPGCGCSPPTVRSPSSVPSAIVVLLVVVKCIPAWCIHVRSSSVLSLLVSRIWTAFVVTQYIILHHVPPSLRCVSTHRSYRYKFAALKSQAKIIFVHSFVHGANLQSRPVCGHRSYSFR